MKKYAVITGASAGIGAEFARQLAARGYPLILIARRRERMEKLAKSLKVRCEIIEADLSLEEECYRVFWQTEDKPVGIFINNAGFGLCGEFEKLDLQRELKMIDLNVRSMHLLAKLFLRKMRKDNAGYLLNVASSAGLMPAGPYMAAYYATKAYVASLTRAIAEELREKGSRVYVGCLCPGPVDTEFNRVAQVEFALKGISAGECVRYALRQMAARKVVIVPTLPLRLAMTLGRFLPISVYVRLAARQQRKKFQP